MKAINYPTYDFTTSARIEHQLWLGFNQWMEKFASLLDEEWGSFSACSISSTPKAISAHEFAEVQDSWEGDLCAVDIDINDGNLTGMIVVERGQLLGVVQRILGGTAELQNRRMTPVESALAKLVIERFCDALIESWPNQSQLSHTLGEIDQQPKRSKKYPKDMLLITSGLKINIGEMVVDLAVLLHKEETRELFAVPANDLKSVQGTGQISPERVAEISVQLKAKLGSTVLGVEEVASMKEGDIIVLEQPVGFPLIVSANNSPVFRAWPGRVSRTQALIIESCQSGN